ncbi:AAA family ATPase [Deinococcus humi]|uniref:DNA-binding SARP family transcriptional activator n=1 Tax=Deinococcus humi TaxID=662880 RepID=A0A7W8NGG9_9DEIO|nr:AAA family ATPase [Deinococcus humi]MBB5363763.1 DNA-binding SARP family transcriptional activator [Deinococcus humi]GGO32083.1 SARP family transcriptional regulator [Deinococcus humi]
MSASPTWQLTLFGTPGLRRLGGSEARCERKTLALLAYLAVEGPTSRAHIAALLWPDTVTSAARNNLVHLLRRITKTYEAALVVGQETLALGSVVTTDLGAWQHEGTFTDNADSVPVGIFLKGVNFDDAPHIEEWLLAWRERFHAARVTQLLRASEAHEEAGQLLDAIHVTEQLVALDVLSEEGYRRLMRLYYLHGDRPAALRAYERCRQLLARELGLEPMPETLRLAGEIDRGALVERAVEAPPRLPLAVLRPPTFVGRDDALRRLDRAWHDGLVVLLSGEAGVGKSRLIQEFAAGRGRTAWMEARPGDSLVPYATLGRALRAWCRAQPAVHLEGWARRALGRMVPDVFPDEIEDLEPMEAHLHAAIRALFDQVTRDVRLVVLEDLHFADAASLDAVFILFASLSPVEREDLPRLACTVRSGELPEALRAHVQRLEDAGRTSRIALKPLRVAEAIALLQQVDVPASLEKRVVHFAGGNPLFLLEMVRHLLEARVDLTREVGTLPIPEKVGQIIERRLSRLSPGALQVARAASVLQRDVHLELVADVLNAPLLSVAEYWEELEAAQIMSGERFAHDLIFESVQRGLPAAVGRLLHRSAARVLSRQAESAARVAHHWQLGGDLKEAALAYLRAAREALAALRSREAVGFFEEAARAYDALDETDAAFNARATALEGTWRFEHIALVEDLARRLSDAARTNAQRARALAVSATRLNAHHQGPQAEEAALAGLRLFDDGPGDRHVRATLLRELMLARASQFKTDETLELTEQVLTAHDALPAEPRAQGVLAVAFALMRVEQHALAGPLLERALSAFEAEGASYQAAWTTHSLASYFETVQHFDRALTLRCGLDERLAHDAVSPSLRTVNRVRQGTLLTRLRAYGAALEALMHALDLARGSGEPTGPLHRAFADVYWALGAFDACEASLDTALAEPNSTDPGQQVPWLFKGLLAAHAGNVEQARACFARASKALDHTNLTYSRGRLLLARAELGGSDAVELARKGVELARRHDHADLLTLALTILAERLLEQEGAHAALPHSTSAVQRLPEHASREDYARPLLAHHRVLSALCDPNAAAPLIAAAAWIEEAVNRVPEEHRQAFLQDHPTHGRVRSLLGALPGLPRSVPG